MASPTTIAQRAKPLPERLIVCEKCGKPVGLKGQTPAIRIEWAGNIEYFHSGCEAKRDGEK